ncbi:hypothetical protein [Winogradskyella wichelsiae]|uniref:hypothetical protein n=1 Tax=Winogradskyella wichelsiae TaxID=2697007 RepID=UPI003EF70D66
MRILIFYLGTLSAIAQPKIFDQDYYSVIKNRTLKFSQVEDMVYITSCAAFDQCEALPNSELVVVKDSLVAQNVRKVFFKNPDPEASPDQRFKALFLIDYKDGRKGIGETYEHITDKILVKLYPKSELMQLKPIAAISPRESQEILLEFDRFKIDEADPKNHYIINWGEFNNLIIERGYNPISAENEVIKKAEQ